MKVLAVIAVVAAVLGFGLTAAENNSAMVKTQAVTSSWNTEPETPRAPAAAKPDPRASAEEEAPASATSAIEPLRWPQRTTESGSEKKWVIRIGRVR